MSNTQIPLKQATLQGSAQYHGYYIIFYPLINQNRFMTSWQNGMIVFVHNSSYLKPSPSEGVYVDLGKVTSIAVRRKFTEKFPSPYSECLDLTSYSSRLYDYLVKTLNQAYRQKDCFELCIQERIIEQCGCYSLEYPNLSLQVRPCLNLSSYYCIDTQANAFDAVKCQTRECPLECDSVTYDLSLSCLTNPSLKEFYSFRLEDKENFEKMLENSSYTNVTFTYDLFKSMWLSVWVYYPSLEYTRIVETPKVTLLDLLTQIGGSLGLFVSFSVFTLFELIEALFLVARILLFK
jgi:hypothetical protein